MSCIESQKGYLYDMNIEKSKPKVSVIIPIYNEEKYLEQCLNSVCRQTLSEI